MGWPQQSFTTQKVAINLNLRLYVWALMIQTYVIVDSSGTITFP